MSTSSDLTSASSLTKNDIQDLLVQLSKEGIWGGKRLVGDLSKLAERTPCIKVDNYLTPYRGLLVYRWVWLAAYGPYDGQIMTVSHLCTSTDGSAHSSCINIQHMRLEPTGVNTGRNAHQWALFKFKKKWESRMQFKGPLFITDIFDENNHPHKKRCSHDNKAGGACFLNCGFICKFTGLYWFNPLPRRLIRGISAGLGQFALVQIDP